MTTVLRLLGIVAFAWLTWFTSTKLIKMCQIRGFISGPAPVSKTVTAKTAEPGRSEPGLRSATHWIAWDGADIQVPSRNRINLPKDVWETYALGDRIEILYFPGDSWPYHRKDIFAENGTFVFDAVLLSLWLAGLITLVAFQIRHFRRKRRKTPPPLPNTYSR